MYTSPRKDLHVAAAGAPEGALIPESCESIGSSLSLSYSIIAETNLKFIYELRNTSEVSRHSRRQSLTAEEVKRDYLQDRSRLSLMIRVSERDAGYISLATTDIADTLEIGIALHPTFHGQGVGKSAIIFGSGYAIQYLGAKELVAYVQESNLSSRKAFVGAGYGERDSDQNGYLKFSFTPAEF